MASGTIKPTFSPNFSASGVSVKTYSASLQEGIHFYSTSSNTADAPTTSSFAYIIFRRATGITILAMALAARELYMSASSNNGSTWSAWQKIAMAS